MSRTHAPTFGSLADLAKAAGVSTSTVSRALAGNEIINVDTRKRIVALAHAHGFQPNQLARNLRLGRAQAIGLVLPLGHETGQHLSDPFFITMLSHLADAVTKRYYDLLLSPELIVRGSSVG
jgi:DNA-binding LacI/PurR family transcriptional regulator